MAATLATGVPAPDRRLVWLARKWDATAFPVTKRSDTTFSAPRPQEELIAAMDRLCFDPSLRETLGGKGYAACRGRWSAEFYISRYLNLIAGIAEKRSIVLG